MTEDTSVEERAMDPHTQDALERGLSRRSFLARTAAGAAGLGVLGLPGLAGNRAEAALPAGTDTGAGRGGAPSFFAKPKPIAEKEIKATKTYDVIVVGAGAAGVPAALSAAENGAKVAVLQKHPFPVSQGNTGTGIDLEKSDKAGVEALVSKIISDNAHRSNPALVRQWAYNSGEAIRWVMDRARQAGSPVVDQGNLLQHGNLKVNGYPLNYVSSFFGPKPYTTGDGMRHLARTAEKAGVEFFYNMPAAQLVQNAAGEVIGVIARGRDGKYVRFLARKGVILACGDYQNNEAMCEFFMPDLKNFRRKQMDRTGDGYAMVFWAGGVVEPIGHTKVMHDFDAGPASMCDMPFLAVNREGKRFVNETAEMSVLSNYLRDKRNAGHYCQIFDSNYMTQAAAWPGRLVPPAGLKHYMPEDPGPKQGVFESLVDTHVADTLEDLARKLGIDPTAFVATVRRYNEIVASGRDTDFGKPANLLIPVQKAPFYGIHRKLGISAICSGMLVDEQSRALDADGKPIKGLYLVGNLGGGFYGAPDYPMTVPGLSLGRCYTFGYLAGRHVARL